MSAIDQYVGYPAYYIEIAFTDSSTGVGFWVAGMTATVGNNGEYPESGNAGAQGPTGSYDNSLTANHADATTSLLEAVSAWASGYDWGALGAVNTVNATEYNETRTPVTL